MLTDAQALFFAPLPRAFPLWAALEEKIIAFWPNTGISVKKTQISLACPHLFACVSLPRRKKDGNAIVVSVSLNHVLDSPRLYACAPIRPGLWTNHILVSSEKDIDDELMGWLDEALRAVRSEE